MCDATINICFLAFVYIVDRYKTTKMCYEVYFMLVYCPDKYRAQRMCDEAVGLVQVKCLKHSIMLYTLMMTYSLMKSQLFTKTCCCCKIFIKLILIMTTIFMKMILN